ncbi:hypothetical protein PC119_g6201 [Phytophthora cactorum]|nr:hypothetical protein PC119_g6201 [Phytophthora cactorum]
MINQLQREETKSFKQLKNSKTFKTLLKIRDLEVATHRGHPLLLLASREFPSTVNHLGTATASRGFATAASDPETPSKWPKQQLITAFGRLREQGGAAARGTWHRERQEGRF